MLKLNKYALTKDGMKKCDDGDFFQQDKPDYQGYTEKILRSLHRSKPLNVRQISEITGIRTRNINGIIPYNIYAGYIRRIVV